MRLLVRRSIYYANKEAINAIHAAWDDVEVTVVDEIKCGNCGNEIQPDDLILSSDG